MFAVFDGIASLGTASAAIESVVSNLYLPAHLPDKEIFIRSDWDWGVDKTGTLPLPKQQNGK